MKFGRTYQLSIQVGDVHTLRTTGPFGNRQTAETIVVNYPLTLEFDVVRNTLGSSNTGRFRIFNLAPDTRKQIFHDRNQTLTYKQVRLQAGYEGQSPLPVIFQGNIMQAYSMRQGVNWVTEIEAFDGAFGTINGQASQTFPSGPSGWNLKDVIKSLFSTMPNISAGVIGDVEGAGSRSLSVVGNSWDIATRLGSSIGAQVFTDNEKANFIKRDEYIADAASIGTIGPDVGILETPRRSAQLLEVTMIFEPRLAVGQLVALQSLETAYNNGPHKVIGIAHRGTISGSVSGSATTTASLDLGAMKLAPIGVP